ncbi:MAG: helix-turn-helix transcriptional regulator [Spirochaetota bacterium]
MKTYRIVGGVLSGICLFSVAFHAIGHWLGDEELAFSYYYTGLLVYALGLVILTCIPKQTVSFQLITRSVTIPVRRINMLYQFFGLIIIDTLLITHQTYYPYVMTISLITFLMGVQYHIIYYKGIAALAAYYLILVGGIHLRSGVSLLQLKLFFNTIFFYCLLFLLFQKELRVRHLLVKKYQKQALDVRERLELYEKQQLDPAVFGLTGREMEVLETLCLTNASNQELADHLGIKIHTVKTHMRNIFDKAGVDDRHQLIDLCRGYFA